MEKRCSYAFGRTLPLDFGAVVRKVDRALEARQITILFRLDMEKLSGRREMPGLILGVFPSGLSPSVFKTDPNLGLLVPSQLAIYGEGVAQTTVMIMDTTCLMDLLRDPAAIAMLMESRSQLEEILESL